MKDTVLLFESESDLRKVVTACLEQIGLRVLEASDTASARKLITGEHPSLLLLELDFPDGKNSALIEDFRSISQHAKRSCRVVIMTEQRIGDEWRRQYKPDFVIYKPFDTRFLCYRVASMLTGVATTIPFNRK
jgi:DNA-binding response OmpR family regulator